VRVQIIGKSKLWLGISIVLVVLSLISIMTKSLNLGIDFTGGSLFEIKFEKPVTLQEINPTLDEIGKSIPQFSANSRIAQVDEKGILILRTQAIDETQKGTVLEGLKNYSKYEVLKSEKVGATVGKELLNSAILSLILGSLLIIAYISFRFELKFALGGVIALVHDIIIAIGVIALLGYEINSSFIAAILTILGYSINDTIVVYDRIRENLKRHKGLSLENIIDNSVNDVMRRSLNTSFTTLLAVLAVLIFGGDTLKSFMVTLLVGIGIGTYSSIFVASPVVYLLEGKLKSKIKL
jgi:preprotein translocase subunit SecF